MGQFIQITALTFVYGGVLLLGLLLIGTSLFALARSFTAGRQTSTQADSGSDLLRAAGLSLGVAAVVFGLVGLLTELILRTSQTSSVLWSLAAGLMAGFLTQVILVGRSRHRATENASSLEHDIVGQEAEVIIAIPADGLGEIACRDDDGLIHLGARSLTGRAIPAHERVMIERVTHRVAIVRPLEKP